MGQAIDQVQHEFWRPPAQGAASDAATNHELSETCPRCGTEFIVGSRFCHSCGATRPGLNAESVEIPGVTEFSTLAERLGLTLASFIAFLVGAVCVIAALAISLIFSVRTQLDWQAIQLWRIEWLTGGIAAFAAGMLLKKSKS